MDEQTILQQAIAAARASRRAEARRLLRQILQANPHHEQAWLWMGTVVETDAERARCLQQVLAINPDNAAARKGLDQLQARMSAAAAPEKHQPDAAPPMALCPHCGAMNRPEAKFCRKCGQRLEDDRPSPRAQTVRCPSCGFENPPGSQFCGQCGRDLSATDPTSPPLTSQSQDAAPQPQRATLQSAATHPSSHFSGNRIKNAGLYAVGGLVSLVMLVIVISLVSSGGAKSKVVGTWESCGLLGCSTWVFERDGDVQGISIDTVTGQYRMVDRNHIEITWDPGVLGGPRGRCGVEKSGGMLILTCPDHTWTLERK